MVRTANASREAAAAPAGGGGPPAAPRRPSIRESTPTPRSVAVAAYPGEEPALSFGGSRGGSGRTDSVEPPGKPKEASRYPSSVGRFFPFGGASPSAASKKSPFAALRPASESPILNEKGGSYSGYGATGAMMSYSGAQSNAPRMAATSNSESAGAVHAKPFYYPGSSRTEAGGGGERGPYSRGEIRPSKSPSAKEAADDAPGQGDDESAEAGWDGDYTSAVRYEDLPPVSATELPNSLLSAAPSTSLPAPPPRTAFRVTDVPLPTILSRIATFLKIHSVACDPKGLVRDGDGTLACVTRRHCQFAIMLWRLEGGRDDERSRGTSELRRERAVLIAIERRQGCCVELQRMRQALRGAIETGRFPSAPEEGKARNSSAGPSCRQSAANSARQERTIAPLIKELYERRVQGEPTRAETSPPLESSQQQQQQQQLAMNSKPPGSSVRRRSSLDGISTCASLLASQCQYKQQLGLENLVAMTDPARGVDPETARDVTDALLLPHCQQGHDRVATVSLEAGDGDGDGDNDEEGDDDDELFKKLQKEFISFFVSSEESFHDVTQSQALSLAVSPAPSAPKLFPDLTESPLSRTIRHSLALEALCNALQVTKSSACRSGGADSDRATDGSNGAVPEARLDLGSDLWRAVIPALLVDVTNARSRPHDAALSAKCLALLQDLHRHDGNDASARAPSASGSSRRQQQQQQQQRADCLMCLDYVETLLPYLVQARSYGSRHHSLLEREANELIGRLLERRQRQHDRPGGALAPSPRHPVPPPPALLHSS